MLRYYALTLLSALTFVSLSVFLIVSPWMLGSWEMWYFWPMVMLLFAGMLFGGLRLLIAALSDREQNADIPDHAPPRIVPGRFLLLLGAWTPFLLYATVRFLQAPVYMDAERIWMLIVTPTLLICTLWLNFSGRQARILFVALAIGMVLQAVYGFIAFYVYEDQYVMWVPNLFGYAGRAQGSFFCPNHFSGYLELGFGMGLALLLAPAAPNNRRLSIIRICFASLLVVATTAGVIISVSRGGAATLIVIVFVAGITGLGQFSRRQRAFIRSSVLGLVLLGCTLIVFTKNPVKERFLGWHAFNPAHRNTEQSLLSDVWQRAQATSRGRQIGGALRAWQSSPVWGIGPGMHQNLWFRFAATGDGDRESGRWPSQSNHTFHSYEVHSDWVQLLEEFGIVGLMLFLIGFGTLCGICLKQLRRAFQRGTPATRPLAAWLGIVAIAFHSIGDFNLQIPAVTWTLAALIALSLVPDRPIPDPDETLPERI